MDKTLQIQSQIRQNAEEVSNFLSDIQKWEKSIKKKDTVLVQNSQNKKQLPIRSGVGTIAIKSENIVTSDGATAAVELNPFTMVEKFIQPKMIDLNAVPRARGVAAVKDPEEMERELGNLEYKKGNFAAAVKSYTKCLGLKAQNYVAFSNRAMANLKLKEYNRVIMDCTCALKIESHHVKSLVRRAAAYDALGKHRAAIRDLLTALEYEPDNKQVRSDLQKSKEALRNAVNRAPLVSLPICRAESRWVLLRDEYEYQKNLLPSVPEKPMEDPRKEDARQEDPSPMTNDPITKQPELIFDEDDRYLNKHYGHIDSDIIPKENHEMEPEDITPIKEPIVKVKKTVSKPKSKSGIKPSTKTTTPRISLNELEVTMRKILNSKDSIEVIEAKSRDFLTSLSLSQLKVSLENVMEPDLISQLYQIIAYYYRSEPTDPSIIQRVVQLYEIIRDMKSFTLIQRLLSDEERRSCHDILINIQENMALSQLKHNATGILVESLLQSYTA